MIELANGRCVRALLRRISQKPDTVRQAFLCSPFVDEDFILDLSSAIVASRTAHSGLTVLTSRPAAARLLEQLPGPPERWHRVVIPMRNLHAKVYLVLGRSPSPSEGVVTSANLTGAGTRLNLEAGVHFTDRSEAGRHLICQALSFLKSMVRSAEHRTCLVE